MERSLIVKAADGLGFQLTSHTLVAVNLLASVGTHMSQPSSGNVLPVKHISKLIILHTLECQVNADSHRTGKNMDANAKLDRSETQLCLRPVVQKVVIGSQVL